MIGQSDDRLNGRIQILITRPITEDQAAYARALGLEPAVLPALTIRIPDSAARISRILDENPGAPWVFTSANAVEALQNHTRKNSLPDPPPAIYAVGDVTAARLAELGLTAASPERQDAIGLAALITEDLLKGGSTRSEEAIPGSEETAPGVERKVIHWCGNRSRKELGEELGKAGIGRIALEVYQSELNRMELPENLGSGILFLSPSAVEACRRSGLFKRPLPELLAVGQTTAEALSLESSSHVHVPTLPSVEAMLELAAEVLGSRRNSDRSRKDS